jgi:DNA-binding MarR family transcriptional regulator
VPHRPLPPSTEVPDRIRERPTWLISRAYARSSILLNEGFAARGDGLRSYHYRLLAALEQWGPVSQAALGRATGIDRSDVTGAMAELEARSLVVRTVNPTDRRRNVVSITKAGLKQLARLDDLIDEIQERFLAPLSPTERRQFLKVMHRLLASP